MNVEAFLEFSRKRAALDLDKLILKTNFFYTRDYMLIC